MSQINVGSH